ncbi:unnamed protein product [Oikopleura dioica]|uniref:Transmembrane protein 9 n=1 Tax=Oikopleura dioica TaxID=34765 RepID=E4YLR6_OIKDI|nr:unnamed protein product [Oikopleura dioica]CBY41855.1 unnamed protein product [Oikopleura dioica]
MLISALLVGIALGNDFSDQRCQCRCPSLHPIAEKSEIYFAEGKVEAKTCTADEVVRPKLDTSHDESIQDAYCRACECKFELRNTGTMEFIVYLYIISIFLLLSYTSLVYFFTEKYQPRVEGDSDRAQLFPRGSQSQSIVDSIMSKIDAMARRWKADVEQQRNTVFNRKTALQ